MFTESKAKEIFEINSIYINGKNVIPREIALEFVNLNAIDHAMHVGSGKPYCVNTKNYGGYGIGDYTISYLTENGWMAAITYMNVSEYRDNIKDNVKKYVR